MPAAVRESCSTNLAAQRYAGVVAAMPTPCTSGGDIDASSATRYAAALTEHGCDGLFVVSSTGEMPFLDEDDRRKLIAAARAGCPRESLLYAGVSGTGVKQTLRYVSHAHREGADVAVVMAPFFVRLGQPELVRYVIAIADASPLPVCLYHHLRMTTSFEVETVGKLAEHPNIIGLKDTSGGDADRLAALLDATRSAQFSIFQGSEKLLHHTLQAGGHGFVTALAAIAPEWHRDVLHSFRENRESEAAIAQEKILALWQMLMLPKVRESFPYFARSLKLAAKHRGWIASTYGIVNIAGADTEFDQSVLDHLKQVGFLQLAAETPR